MDSKTLHQQYPRTRAGLRAFLAYLIAQNAAKKAAN
jgi:hypothetical protein